MINTLVETAQPAEVQETSFTIDVLGRYICSTWDEATPMAESPSTPS
jgi:hypothetical protein